MSIHVAVGLVPVKRFNHEGLHQFVTDQMKTLVVKTFHQFEINENPGGRNVLLEPDLQLRECSSTLHIY